jgi:biopolymer transport protein ExbD
VSSSTRALLFASLTATAIGACSKKPCNEEDLKAAASALEDRSIAGREAGVAALGRACPGMPGGLAHRLDLAFGHSMATGRTIPIVRSDPAYTKLHEVTCPCPPDAWQAALARWDPDEAVFEACDLDRYGLRQAEEPFMVADLPGYVLYEWLTASHIDEALARQVVRGLISANTSEDELAQICRLQNHGCEVLVSRAGVSLPRSTASGLPDFERATHLWLTEDYAYVDGERLRTIARANEGPLSRVLANAAETRRALAAERFPPWPGAVVVAADGDLDFAAVAAALFSATRNGHEVFELAVAGDRGVHAIRAQPPQMWRRPQLREPHDGPRIDVFIHLDAIEIEADGRVTERIDAAEDCAASPSACLDAAAIEAAFARLKQADPGQEEVDVHVEPGVRYQTVITLLDLARGECGVPDQGAGVPDTCVSWRPRLNLDPPLHWNMGASVTLGKASASRFDEDGQRVEVPDSKQLNQLEAARAQLLDCLTSDPGFLSQLSGDDASLSVLWGSSPTNGEVVAGLWTGFVGDPWAEPELQACVLRLFDATAAAPEHRLSLVTRPALELELPLELRASQ